MEGEERKAGRPKLGVQRRVRITTTIEPSKLVVLRLHAQHVKKSLGQLADEYVSCHFIQEMGALTSDDDASRHSC
jgi:hypothetical protein